MMLLGSIAYALILVPLVQGEFENLFPINFDQHPFIAAGPTHVNCTGTVWAKSSPPRIAIIGAGASGSFAAYLLSEFGKLENLESDITVFDSNSYVGGRSTVLYPWNDKIQEPISDEDGIEAGASIFVKSNKNLNTAADLFNLTKIEAVGESGGTTFWDGEEEVYTEKSGFDWGLSFIKLWWRYGRTPTQLSGLVKSTVDRFNFIYSPEFTSLGPYETVEAISRITNLSSFTQLTGRNYFDEVGLDSLFTSELLSAASQVNYGQPIEEIHALGSLVSLAASGAMQIKGGNRKIFESFIEASGAQIRLEKEGTVRSLLKLDGAQRSQWMVGTEAGGSSTFDAIILATPFHSSSISIINSRAVARIPRQEYVHLHVTFIITNATQSTLSNSKSIYSTFSTKSINKPNFNSISYQRIIPESISTQFGPGDYHVVKMFSAKKLEEEYLNELFGLNEVTKVVRKEWDAYPKLEPVGTTAFASVRPDQGLYYVNGFEKLISTMETETIAAENVVRLLLSDFFEYRGDTAWNEWKR